MDLNLLQSKRLPDFLQRLVSWLLQLTMPHVCSVGGFYDLSALLLPFGTHNGQRHWTSYHCPVHNSRGLLFSARTVTQLSPYQALRNEATSQDTRQRSLAQKLLEQVALKRASELLHLHTCDLHLPREQAMTSVRWEFLWYYDRFNQQCLQAVGVKGDLWTLFWAHREGRR